MARTFVASFPISSGVLRNNEAVERGELDRERKKIALQWRIGRSPIRNPRRASTRGENGVKEVHIKDKEEEVRAATIRLEAKGAIRKKKR